MNLYEHPQHGFTYAAGQLEVARLLANGWSEVVPVEAEKPAPEPAPIQEPERRKPGRPKKAQQ